MRKYRATSAIVVDKRQVPFEHLDAFVAELALYVVDAGAVAQHGDGARAPQRMGRHMHTGCLGQLSQDVLHAGRREVPTYAGGKERILRL